MEQIKFNETLKKPKPHPYTQANIISKFFFLWTFPLFLKGLKKDLDEDDLFPHLPSHESKYLGDKLERQWVTQLKRSKERPSLWRALAGVFGKQAFVLGVFYMILEIFIRLTVPLFLAQLLTYYEPDTTMSKSEAYYYASAIVVCTFISATSQHIFMMHNFHLGMKMKVATSTLIYRKALKLSKSALAETTVGQMVNLISNDAARFELATVHFHYLWLAPLETVIVLVLMYFYVGYSGMIGVILLLAFVPYQMYMGKKTSIYRLATAIKTDERIRLMNEIISGIQVIKMYTWERPFAKLVEISRGREMDQIRKISFIRAIMMSFNLFLSSTAIYICILLYVLTGHTVDAQYIYILQSLYGVLRVAVTMFFPAGITQFAEANISVRRIQAFLEYSEVKFDSSDNFFNEITKSKEVSEESSEGSISLRNVSVKWLKTRSENTLEGVNMDVGPGELAVVIGPVGSGKTTILHAILKELTASSGEVRVKGKISYASQEPWLFVGSVRQNITFGQKFDARRYHEVVRVCQLQRDFTLFPYGDRTIVGERGVSLSGGQRARINLARAVYKQADIYLLDDPLSAVDSHVGRQMFDECIMGYLKSKCVVLVTHQLQYLKTVQKIYLLGRGRVEHQGTYEEIQNAGTGFSQLLNDLKEIIDDEEVVEEGETEEVTPEKRRRVSTKEVIPKNDTTPTMEKEGKGAGTVSKGVYLSYFLSGGHWCKILILGMAFAVAQFLSSGCDYYLKIWVNMNQLKKTLPEFSQGKPINTSELDDASLDAGSTSYFENFWLTNMTEDVVLITYSILVVLVIILTIGRSLAFYRFCNKASVRLHNNMFYKIVYATMRFFNFNTSGRILNRFSKDMNQVDEVLPLTLLDTIQISMNVVAITIMVASINPWMLIPTVVILIMFYLIRIVFLASSRDIKRLEALTRSPIYSHLTASLQGLTTIRAFGAQEILKVEFDKYQNAFSSAYFMFLGANRAFGFWLDMHCVVFIALVTMSFLFFETESFGGNVGLAITQSMTLTGMFQWGMRQWSELENTMTCVERIKEYADVEPESDNSVKEPPKYWPQEGRIDFVDLTMRYSPGEAAVLKNLSFKILSGEKVGIVGRTGAGKSSIIIALFRLAVNEGKIIIDDVDTSTISLTKLRSSIAIIPQEPVLFSGTLRKNLDPFDEHSDESIWHALAEVELKTAVTALPSGLESTMSEGGSNFSVGQRQLVCLARAIIRNNKILVLDEATANVDPQTDTLIQTTIRRKFSDCTVLTIAHRLHTIMDSDKVLVMDAGRNVEFGHPHELLQREDGVFYQLVQQTGKAMADNLSKIAKTSYTTSSVKPLLTNGTNKN